jgi:AcrR family transcriptional regulator
VVVGNNGRVQTTSRRADARRSRERIIAAAVTTLAHDPSASLERVAGVAGVHRATIHRHFHRREELIEAVVARAITEGRAVVGRVSQLPADPQAVHSLAADANQFGRKYSFLIGTSELADAGPDPIGLSELMKTWQVQGVLRDDVTPEWLTAAFVALAQVLVAPGVIRIPREGHKVLAEMFLHGAAS